YSRGEAEDYIVNIGPFGNIQGYVYEYNSVTPIPDAAVALRYDSYTTGPDGYFLFEDIGVGNYSLVCNADGFVGDTVYGVQVTPNNTTTQDIYLTWPELTVDPDNVNLVLSPNSQTNFDIVLTNTGSAPLNYFASTQYPASETGGESNSTEVTGDILIDIDAQSACSDMSLNGAVYLIDHYYISGFIPDGSERSIFKLDLDGNFVNEYVQTTTSYYGMRALSTDGGYV
ncbi:MAG: carboxypeptidase-like regulatory domain-containing protein, partial [Bacteroidales bacterium]|nr:carboxypeptidase-like regulatory domain-containing protein [Bacteroidales bacterium]